MSCTLYIIADKTTALVVSSGCQVSHVLPVLNGRLDASNCKRSVATCNSLLIIIMIDWVIHAQCRVNKCNLIYQPSRQHYTILVCLFLNVFCISPWAWHEVLLLIVEKMFSQSTKKEKKTNNVWLLHVSVSLSLTQCFITQD